MSEAVSCDICGGWTASEDSYLHAPDCALGQVLKRALHRPIRRAPDDDLAHLLVDFLARPIPDEIFTDREDLERIAEQRRERTRAVSSAVEGANFSDSSATLGGWGARPGSPFDGRSEGTFDDDAPHHRHTTRSDGDEVSTVDESGVRGGSGGTGCCDCERVRPCPNCGACLICGHNP